MFSRSHFRRFWVVAAAVGLSIAGARDASAQINVGVPSGGVEVDPSGVLSVYYRPDETGQLMKARVASAVASMDAKLAAESEMRMVSITRLEKAIAERLERGEQPSDEMMNLAGLTRIEYVFFYPESGDIVIAGPAEGFVADMTGRMVGVKSRRATLQLEDLAVALRAFPPSGKPTGVIRCSIDPTKEGLAAYNQTVRGVAARMNPRQRPNNQQIDGLVNALRESLGLHTVTVGGVPAKSHFAKVLVEADYRMKLISIGMEKLPASMKIRSYVALANPAAAANNSMKRWYFVPDYQCVRATDEGDAMQLVGQGVKLIAEDELVAADGSRSSSGQMDRAAQAFVTGFTQNYARLATASPVFAELRNVIDLSVAAAFIQQHRYYEKAKWDLGVLGSEDKFPVEKYHAPKQVPTACTALWKGNRLVTPIGGGVQINPADALVSTNLLPDDKGLVKTKRSQIDLNSALSAGQWWWD